MYHCKFLLFDLDGTLTDPKEGVFKCIDYAFSELGLPAPSLSQLEGCIGPPLHAMLSQLISEVKQSLSDQEVLHWVDSAADLYRDRYSKEGLFENSVYPGIVPCLQRLQEAGKQLFVATSKPQVFAEKILHRFDLFRFFKGVYGISLTARSPDKSELISELLQKEEILGKQSVMIGDRKFDILGGRQNQTYTIGVSWGHGTRQELLQAGADVICDLPQDLVSLWVRHSA